MRRVAIVGGGAAGIYAALAASRGGAAAAIHERNPRIGIKIMISGGGKCNVTHDVSPREIEEGFIRREARFLRYALHELGSADVLADLHGEGVETYTRPNGRVFPVSGRAEDVLAAFERLLVRAGVEVRGGSLVEEPVVRDGAIVGVRIGGRMEPCDAAIVCTGGMSYRKVGTTGDGIRWAERLGHTIVPVRAALAPIYFPAPPSADWQGVALRDVMLTLDAGDETAKLERQGYHISWRDDLLLTHRGASGPAVLEVSRAAALARERGARVGLVADLLPDVGPDELATFWKERVGSAGKSEVQTLVESWLPRALVPAFLAAGGVERGTKLAAVTREERAAILSTLKAWRFGEAGEIPIDRGEVTAGGIALDEVSPTTMESKLIRGLYFAGEALDVAGSVGGYNLQAAFSTGWVAGRSSVEF